MSLGLEISGEQHTVCPREFKTWKNGLQCLYGSYAYMLNWGPTDYGNISLRWQ